MTTFPVSVASASASAPKSYRRILVCHQLWILKAHLDESIEEEDIAARRRAV